ncbi:ArsR family transcriptional regulator [Halobacteriales archaeon QH_10_70_21]|nr:MAG: ArsR family transcriptional regulator [Halobacteriales archaeon QH_10_70_21]
METADIDELDERIIYELQRDARHTSASDIADECGVSPSTVRKRIQGLEEAGVLRGYHPDVDYERAGYQLRTLIIGTAPIPEREELARAALDVDGVVAVREVMTGSGNLHVEVVGADGDDLSRIGRDLDALGIEVEDEDLIRNEYENPYERFATESRG